ncbi:SIS domain-containing protein [Mollicutes bacterium LVI A0039]|nr:SIS domain-containing protein [Mollicutes bacterium LVI A0039]
MPDSNIKHYISNCNVSLTATEAMVQEYILQNWEETFCGKTIAKQLNISQASISKFIKKICFKSLHELNTLKGLNEDQLVEYIISNKSKFMNNSLPSLHNSKISEIVECVEASQKIFTFGIGHSYICAYNFYQRFNKIGYTSVLLRERNDINIHLSSMLDPNSLVFIFSDSSTTKEVVNFSEFCIEHNIKYIVFTSDPTTYVSRNSFITLSYTKNNIGFLLEAIGPEEPIIYLIDIIYLHVMSRNYSRSLTRFQNSDLYTKYN